jgi:hypothetical protein
MLPPLTKIKSARRLSKYVLGNEAKSRFHSPPADFWPENVIESLRDEDLIRRVLTTKQDAPSDELVSFIVSHAIRLFAISATVFPEPGSRLLQAMETFRLKNFGDEELSAETKDGNYSGDYSDSLRRRLAGVEDSKDDNESERRDDDDEDENTSDEDEENDRNKLWHETNIRAFDQCHWKALAPTFSTDRLDYNFKMNTILPFLEKETNNDRKGAFSVVYKVSIHPSHYADSGIPVSVFGCF